jgi:hypothetical protein
MKIKTFTFNVGKLNKYIDDININLLDNHLNNIFKPNIDTIYFISTQEDNKKSFLINKIIDIFVPEEFKIQLSYFSSWSNDFNIHNLIIIPNIIFERNLFTFLKDIKINHNLVSSKGTIINRLSNDDTEIYFIASHLPMNKNKDDLGLSERISAMQSVITDLKINYLDLNKQNYILWIGDLNFRLYNNGNQDQLLEYLDKVDNDIIFKDLSDIYKYDPTCKTLMFDEKIKCDETCIINDTSCDKPCYDIKSKSGKRDPSYCDRILGWSNVGPFENFNSYGITAKMYDFIKYSDHNPVVSEIILPDGIEYTTSPLFKGGNIINYSEKINKYKNKYRQILKLKILLP